MRYPLLFLLSFVLVATRSIAFGTPSKAAARRTTSADTEYQALLIIILCLIGLLVSLYLMIRFPEIGAIIAETDQF